MVVMLLHGFSKTSNQTDSGGEQISGVWIISDDDEDDDDDGIFFSFIINLLFGSSDNDGIFFSFIINLLFGSSAADGIFLLFHQPLGPDD